MLANILFIIDYWADPSVHLLLQESFVIWASQAQFILLTSVTRFRGKVLKDFGNR